MLKRWRKPYGKLFLLKGDKTGNFVLLFQNVYHYLPLCFRITLHRLDLCSSRQAVDESEVEAQERKSMRCIWVSGKKPLTEREAAQQIIAEARLLLQQDLARLGVEWNPAFSSAKAQPDSSSLEDTSSTKSARSVSSSKREQKQNDEEMKLNETAAEKKLINKSAESSSSAPDFTANSEKLMQIDLVTENAKKCEQPSSALHKVLKSLDAKDESFHSDRTPAPASDCSSEPIQRHNFGHNSSVKNGGISDQHCVSPLSKRRRVDDKAELTEAKTSILTVNDSKPSSTDNKKTETRIDKNKTRSQSLNAKSNRENELNTFSHVHAPLQNRETPHLTTVLTSYKKFTSKTKHLNESENHKAELQEAVSLFRKFSNKDKNEYHINLNSKAANDSACNSEKLCSPDLYANGPEEFNDSFQLDTQTEKMLLQVDDFSHRNKQENHVCQMKVNQEHGNSPNTNKSTEKEQIENPDEGLSLQNQPSKRNSLTPTEAKPKYNISLTDSQLENILNYSNQVSEEESCLDKKSDNHESSDQVTDNSPNRSSSFLFDSLYDNSILDAMEEAATDRENKEDPVVELHTNTSISEPNRDRRDAVPTEDQEAKQWGESSFNLSEWGDSLLIGEHYLDKLNSVVKACDGPALNPGEAKKPSYKDNIHESESNESRSEMKSQRRPLNGSSFHFSPGMQDIFDKWSDQFSTLAEAPGQANSAVVESDAVSVLEVQAEGAVQTKPVTPNDLIPPTPVSEPVTPKVKMTTSALQSPLNSKTKQRCEIISNSTCSVKKDYYAGLKTNSASDMDASLGDDSCSPESFSIIDVASDKRLFQTFIKEWKTKDRFSVAVACEKIDSSVVQPENFIGGKFKKCKTFLA